MNHKSYNDRTCLETRFNGPNGPTISCYSESQSRLEASKFQGRRHDLAQNAHLGNWSSRTEELHDTSNGPGCESIVHETLQRKPALKLQASIQLPSEEDDLEETILQLRLLKSIGYADQEIAIAYCSKSAKLRNMFCYLQSVQKTDLEQFFNALRSRRPVNIDKAINEFFKKRQGQNEDEEDVMFFLQSRYKLMHGHAPGQLDGPVLTEGDKCLLRHQFIKAVAIKDEEMYVHLRTSDIKFEDLTSKARSFRLAREAVEMMTQVEEKKKEQNHLSFFSSKLKLKTEEKSGSTKVKMDSTKETKEIFKGVSNNRVARFHLFKPSKLKFPPRILEIFDPKPNLIYKEGQDQGHIIFDRGECAHLILKKMKTNPMVKRGIGKIQFWPIKDGAHPNGHDFRPQTSQVAPTTFDEAR